MKSWQRKRFKDNDWSEPAATVTGRFWYRLRGQYIAYSGAPIATPLLVNPRIHPAVKALWRIGYARRFAAWKLAQVDINSGNGRQPKTVFEMAQQVDMPRFTQRPQEPSDFVKSAFPYGVAFAPARPPSVEADITPHLQFAGISGGLAAGLLFLLLAGLIWFTKWSYDWYLIALYVSVVTGLAYAWYQWTVSTARARVSWWMMELEREYNTDLNNDGFIGEPVARMEPREIPTRNRKGGETTTAVEDKSDITGYSWQSFAIAVMCQRTNISKESICKETANQSKYHYKVSQPQYLAIYNMMQKNQYMKGGNELTQTGWQYLSRWVPESHQILLPCPEDGS
jgi:hypothetical protein